MTSPIASEITNTSGEKPLAFGKHKIIIKKMITLQFGEVTSP